MSGSTNPVLNALMERRSGNARALVLPAPNADQLHAILEAGARAPDHGRLVPFRFLQIADAARPKLADLLEASSLALTPDLAAPEIERAREKADQGPMILALIAKIDEKHPKIIASDQWLAVGCALENMVLAIQSLGFAVAIRSGAFLNTMPMRAGFALADSETMVCLLAIGTASDWPPAKPKPSVEQVFSIWHG